MDIRLNELKLANFKGCKDRTIAFNGLDASIYGDNGTGKTTLADAFTWLLFDKNSLGDSNFDIKPVDADRPRVEVTANLSIDDKEVELKKVLTEKWVKKRGEEEAVFSGHTTAYYVNEVERSKGEFTAYLDSIISEKTFRMLTSADYFLGLKKPEMRSILVDMAGDVNDQEIAGDDVKLIELVQTMQDKDYTLDDLFKLVRQNIALYSAEQRQIDPRIDEVRRSMPEDMDYSKLEAGLSSAKEHIADIDKKLTDAREAMKGKADKQNEIDVIQSKMSQYREEQIEKLNESFFQKRVEIEKTKLELEKAKSAVFTHHLEALERQLKNLTTELHGLAFKYKEIAQQKKELAGLVAPELAEDDITCDKCGQSLPEGDLKQMKEELVRSFNVRKKKQQTDLGLREQSIAEQGQTLSTSKKEIAEHIEDERKRIENARETVDDIQDKLDALEGSIVQTEPVREVNLSDDPVYMEMYNALEGLKAEMGDGAVSTEMLLSDKSRLEAQVYEIQKMLQTKDKRDIAEARITELTARGKHLAQMIAKEKNRQFQVERFLRLKSEKLEDKINSMFDNISFRLFDIQVNGGIVDDCTPLIRNVDYKSASNSERIRANLDIISAMQRAHETTIVCFVDNAEAATYLRDMDCQLIRLVVSEQDKFLRIELAETEKGAIV